MLLKTNSEAVQIKAKRFLHEKANTSFKVFMIKRFRFRVQEGLWLLALRRASCHSAADASDGLALINEGLCVGLSQRSRLMKETPAVLPIYPRTSAAV